MPMRSASSLLHRAITDNGLCHQVILRVMNYSDRDHINPFYWGYRVSLPFSYRSNHTRCCLCHMSEWCILDGE